MRKQSIRIIISFIAAGAILLLYFFSNPNKSFFPQCIFYNLTGFYCPGCGVQRSFHSLLHGNFIAAIDYNILFVFLLPFILYFLFYFIINGKRSKALFIYNKKFSYFMLVVFLSFWVLRNIPVYPFSWLAP